MALKFSMKRALVCFISFYFLCRLNLHCSLGLSSFNKSSLFVLVNGIVFLMIIIHNFSGTSNATTTCGNFVEELEEELVPRQSHIIIEETMSNDSLCNDEYVEDKSIILVEKYAKEEEHGEEEEIMLGIFLHKEVDTGWRRHLIRESSSCSELVAVKYLVPEVKKVVSIDHELDKLDVNAVNRKFDEFIGIQKRTWQLDAGKQPQLVK